MNTSKNNKNYVVEEIISELTNSEFWDKKSKKNPLNRSKIQTAINNYSKRKDMELSYSSCFTYKDNKSTVSLSLYLLKHLTVNIYFVTIDNENISKFEYTPLKFSTPVKYSSFELFYKNEKVSNENLFKIINNSLIEDLDKLMKDYRLTKDEIINVLSSDN